MNSQDACKPMNPFYGMDVFSLLSSRARTSGTKAFLIWSPFNGAEETWTYAAFERDVRTIAISLTNEGITAGDSVLIHLDNCPEAHLAWHACAAIGAIAVTTNTKCALEEMRYFAGHCRPKLAVTQSHFAEMMKIALPGSVPCYIVSRDPDGGLIESASNGNGLQFSSLLKSDPEGFQPVQPDPERRLSVQYTSGTTSRPKGVVWTHANALWGAQVSARHEGLTENDVHFVHLPLYHTNALCYSALATLWAGACFVLAPRFSASRFWPAAVEHKCTISSMIPFCVKALQAQPMPGQHFFRLWLPAIAMPDAEAQFGLKTFGWWGMTETITHGIVGSPFEREPALSIGRPAASYEISVVVDGRAARSGETGELLIKGVRGLSLFLEYLHDAEATASAFDAHGNMITGDRVTIGQKGHLFFADRSKDMLKVGGENVAASEIERVLLQVRGVSEAAVVGKPDAMLGEVPVAFITLNGTASEAHVRNEVFSVCAKSLSNFKQVRELFIVDHLPRSTLEKVAKAELRKRFSVD